MKVAHVEDIHHGNPTERFPEDKPAYPVTDTRVYTQLGDQCMYVQVPFQTAHDWPDLEEINDCDLIVYHGGAGIAVAGNGREPLHERLARFRRPVFLSLEPGDYESIVCNTQLLFHGLRRAVALPHVVGLMLQVPYHYRVLKRLVGKAVFVPPPTIVHREWRYYTPVERKEGIIVPRNIIACLGLLENNQRNGHVSAMAASDGGARHGQRIESLIGGTRHEYRSGPYRGVITDDDAAMGLGVANYSFRGNIDGAPEVGGPNPYLEALSKARLMVNLDATGSWGRMSYESVLMGTPAVVSNRLFSSLCFPHTRVDPMDLRGAARLVDRVLSDKGFYEEVVAVGKRRTIKLCDPPNVLDRMVRYSRKAGLWIG